MSPRHECIDALWTNTILTSSSPLSILLLHKNMLIEAVENMLYQWSLEKYWVTIRFQHRCYLLQSPLACILAWLKYKCLLDTMLEWYKFHNDEKILYVKSLRKFINKKHLLRVYIMLFSICVCGDDNTHCCSDFLENYKLILFWWCD